MERRREPPDPPDPPETTKAPKGKEITCRTCGAVLDENGNRVRVQVWTRWKYTGTVVSTLILLSLPTVLILAGLGFISLAVLTQSLMLLYGTVTLMAATWLFGQETLSAVRSARAD